VLKRLGVLVVVMATAVAALATAAAGQANASHGATTGARAATTRAAAGSFDTLLKAAVADIQAYWTKEFPKVYGGTYQPMGQIVAAGANTKIPACQGQTISYQKDVKGNAFYCFQSNFITYDNQTLFPSLAKDFGNFAPALVLAHEWGHAIQDRAGIGRSSQPTILIELQADCFAGSWVKRIANGDSKTVKFAGGDLDTALAAYLTFRDSIGTTPSDTQAHGDAFDRVNAFQTGFDNGATACKSFFDSPPPITEQQFTTAQDAATGGNLPAAQVLPVTMELLNEFYAQVTPSIPPLTIDKVFKYNSNGAVSQDPKCGGTRLAKKDIKNRVLYCLDDSYIAFDAPLLNDIYKKIGDFGVASLIGDTYATYIQFKQGFPGVKDNTVNAVLGADCYTGAWAQAVASGLPSRTLNGPVTLSPGDLDKVIQAFITYDAARGVSARSDFVFRRMEAFRAGFFSGFASCGTTFGASSTSTSSG
jgi:predicted metalloprotease